MNEASSKFVDRIAVQKLVEEKLSLVNHSPNDDKRPLPDDFYRDFSKVNEIGKNCKVIGSGENTQILFESSIESNYEENNLVATNCHLVENAKGTVIFVHGLYDDNALLYHPLINELNKQHLNVYSLTLPFHFTRKPEKSVFGGEYFFSANIYRTYLAIKQAVYDLYQLYNFLKQETKHKVSIIGFSMGGGVAMNLAALVPDLDELILVNSLCRFSDIIWDTDLCQTIKGDFAREGFDETKIRNFYQNVDPVILAKSSIDRDRILFIQGLYDQINKPEFYQELQEAWCFTNRLEYKAAHLNIFRVPRLSMDIADFYFRETRENSDSVPPLQPI